MKQAEALRLADRLDANLGDTRRPASLELRRQHALIEVLTEALKTAEACIYAHGKPVDPAITTALSKAKGQ